MNQKPIQLHEGSLANLPRSVKSVTYDRTAVTLGIVHFGVGGFHRAHQAAYTHELLEAGQTEWGIVGAGVLPRDRAMRDALVPQGCLYTLVEQSAGSATARVIGSIREYVYAPESANRLLGLLAHRNTRIVSMTVTEGGYFYDFSARRLREGHPDVRADMRGGSPPRTWIGFVVEALAQRREAGVAPFTVMSCDNIPENGHAARTVVTELAGGRGRRLADWIAEEVAFPSTMVDRITPATSEANRDMLRATYGVEDRWPVFCEDFRQWVIEDSFTVGRPTWDTVGAKFVPDVYPYELMKIRLLNGTHSALSYIAYLLGYRDVDAAVSDADLSAFIRRYMREIARTLEPVPGVDVAEYQETLVTRFSNPAIKDQVTRLAMEGSQKIANSIAPPVAQLLEAGNAAPHAAFAVAAWIRFCSGPDEAGEAIEIDDPMADTLAEAARTAVARGDARAFLSLTDIFGETIVAHEGFVDTVAARFAAIGSRGIRKALREFLGSPS
jgi:mannitol 2-dehydrogenase